MAKKVIKQNERKEYTVEMSAGGLKKGEKVKLHPITAESLKKKGIIK